VDFELLLSINDIDNIWNLSFVHFAKIGFMYMYFFFKQQNLLSKVSARSTMPTKEEKEDKGEP